MARGVMAALCALVLVCRCAEAFVGGHLRMAWLTSPYQNRASVAGMVRGQRPKGLPSPAARQCCHPRGPASGDIPLKWGAVGVRRAVSLRAPQTVRLAGNRGAAGKESGANKEDLLQRLARVPVLGLVVRFATWVVDVFRSILLVRIAVLLRAMAQLKTALLDPQRRLSAPGTNEPRTSEDASAASPLATATMSAAAASASTPGATAQPTSRGREQASDLSVGVSWEPEGSSEVAFQAFWRQMDQLSPGSSVQSELQQLQEESRRERALQEDALAEAAGVKISVLDFVERGGLPPSVEALTAWLEIRDIDTSQWGCGEAKTVQEFFHELWAGESEPLGAACQRVISVVKVRILDANDEGTWQLYETKQTLCRDGRTRPRNRPLAEKLRPGEEVEACCRRGVLEELGSLVGASPVHIRDGSLQHWEETRMSRSFPGLETLYKLYQVDVNVEGLTLNRTGATFETEEDPGLSTNKVHRWEWVPCGGVAWDPVSTG